MPSQASAFGTGALRCTVLRCTALCHGVPCVVRQEQAWLQCCVNFHLLASLQVRLLLRGLRFPARQLRPGWRAAAERAPLQRRCRLPSHDVVSGWSRLPWGRCACVACWGAQHASSARCTEACAARLPGMRQVPCCCLPNAGRPVVLLKGGPGTGPLDLADANINLNAVLYRKRAAAGAAVGSGGGLSAGAIAGECWWVALHSLPRSGASACGTHMVCASPPSLSTVSSYTCCLLSSQA